ncbi:MAG: hypothetical protein NTX68_12390 [Rhodococcus sp.]|nr:MULTISPECIES: hypothetical protein [Rhodococcus]MCX6491768.1 hypothetical protein [Rhodococcus sp. (in: high G+C Gram-positive bacteria)]MDJ0469145.1 hypothetical protein [Rhodococcus fascians]
MSEFPPSSKKSSSRPTRSTPSTWAYTSATVRSMSLVGSRYSVTSNAGSGNAFRSSFPLAPSGNSGSTISVDGTMYSARRPRSADRTAPVSTDTPEGTTYPTSWSRRTTTTA